MNDCDLYQKQLELESQATELGRQRYLSACTSSSTGKRKKLKDQPVGHCLIRALCGPVGRALDDLLNKSSNRCHRKVRETREQLAALELTALEMAYIGVRTLLAVNFGEVDNTKGSYGTVASISVKIGRSMVDEVKAREFGRVHGAYVARVLESQRRNPSKDGIHRILSDAKERLMGTTETDRYLSNLDAFSLGAEVLKVILAVCPDYFILSGRGKHSRNRIVPAEALLQWLADRDELAAVMRPVHRPMVVPPLDWVSPKDGGYLSQPLRMVRRTNPTVRHQTHISESARAALNIAQRTPWRINRGVFEVADQLFRNQVSVAGLSVPVEIPSDLPDGSDPEDVRARKHEQRLAYQTNIRISSAICADQIKLDIARDYKDFERIYFPHTFDWRSRIYPVPTTLNPQGDDLAKGLLQFSEAEPLGDKGSYWLAVHGANCYGRDKLPYKQRVQWVIDNTSRILWSAKEPLADLWWAEADEPFKFLAFCLEWAGMHQWEACGQPRDTYRCRLPVALDGTCSGLQHFSALLRDERGAASVNLIPAPEPADIYSEVAQEIRKGVDSLEDCWQKRVWDGMINRTTAKRGTMTQPYGVTKRGLADQLEDLCKTSEEFSVVFDRCAFERARMRDRYTDEEWEKVPLKPSLLAASIWLSDQLEEAINRVVVASQRGRDFLQALARVYGENDTDFQWVTPNGSRISQGYRSLPTKRVETYFGGTRVQTRLAVDDSGDIPRNGRKSSGGSSPNFIHSLDATHLLWTVADSYKNGIRAFSLVHDSFGVHPGKVETLNVVLRNTFVRLYSTPVLEGLLETAREVLGPEVELPELPQVGSLDIEAVRFSPYIFM